MSTILAIETSAESASAALLREGTLISREVEGVVTHSQTILPMVQSLLNEAGIPLAECNAIAYGAGPGSFTGVRTACGIAQGLAFGAELPVVPLVTLLALAQACHEQGSAKDVLAIIDARMGEVYWAQYRYEGEWQVIIEPALSAPNDVAPLGVVTACGNGLKAYSAAFQERDFYAHAWPDLMPHAKQVAILGERLFMQGVHVDAAHAEPLYLRNKVALTTRERQEKAERAVA
ncbi:tRNA (adenosine(37)-N6)-threonylcarbamoyltransferase complex dimerization subunit type 1 TsaB [uncultured Oxalicibacterium sp.]|uniref:tRNA (adenosine(37)-N6)-threonylcarbamoyltransferase complex dimerization subunit type 1 TsaB n=1 Tax=uncultured Oxalicibacterium sp. TaxID=1168540 RepID=UPI0025CEA72F|nr:tRNA (adenosine(37)-N6)-threonylcarbamoyltransferase complex dimerization subunit type 1 TsaB [uncultured Oxalicibacterium sp.]